GGSETTGGTQTRKNPEPQSLGAMVSGEVEEASLVLPRIVPRDLAQSDVGEVSSRAPSPTNIPAEAEQDAAVPDGDVLSLLRDATAATEPAPEASAPILPDRSIKQDDTPAVDDKRASLQLSSSIPSSQTREQSEADDPDSVPLAMGLDAPTDMSRADGSGDAKPLHPKPLEDNDAEVKLGETRVVENRPNMVTDIGRTRFVNEVPTIASPDDTVTTRGEADPVAASVGLPNVAEATDLSASPRPIAAGTESPSHAALTPQHSELRTQRREMRTDDIAAEKRPADPTDSINTPTKTAPKPQIQLATLDAQDTESEPVKLAQTSQVAGQLAAMANAETQALRAPKAGETRVKTESGVPRTTAASIALPPIPEISPVRPATPVEDEPELDADTRRAPLPAVVQFTGSAVIAPSQTGQSPLEFGASQTTITQPQASAMPVAPQTGTPTPLTDTSTASRLSPQIENMIDQLTETRSAAQTNRPELTVRHQEFGAITMRLEAMGNDLRATLTARDPGFVPAIQTALVERSVAASSETTGTGTQRGNEHSSAQSGSHSGSHNGQFAGSPGGGWNPQGNYGSSTGAGQGTSQPYTGQTENRDEDSGSERGNKMGRGTGSTGEGEIFA
ncbi:MAG: hypothetical protein AAFY42_10700, partial [Pseudomonadota bacterium]